MIDLDRKDIKAVASGRFTRRWRWHLLGYLIFCMILLGGLGFLVSSYECGNLVSNIVFLPLVLILGGFGFWSWKLDKAEKRLVKEWEGE